MRAEQLRHGATGALNFRRPVGDVKIYYSLVHLALFRGNDVDERPEEVETEP